MKIVKIISSAVEKSRLIVKYLRLGKHDIQTSYNVAPFGIDANPIKGMKAIQSSTGERGDSVILGYINDNMLAAKGEIRIFAVDSDGVLQNYIHIKNNGDIEIGGDADNMVRYSELKSGFDDLRDDFNNFVNTKFNTHTHVAPSGTTAVPVPLGSPSAADISGSKIGEIKTS